MKPILITGANGYIGRQLADQLLQNGHTIIATSRNGLCDTIKMDFTNETEIKNVFFVSKEEPRYQEYLIKSQARGLDIEILKEQIDLYYYLKK